MNPETRTAALLFSWAMVVMGIAALLAVAGCERVGVPVATFASVPF